jgi:hypothetical protein
MTTPATPSDPQPANDDRNLVKTDETTVAPGLDEQLHGFWQKNGRAVLTLCVLVGLGILAKGGWELYQSGREKDIEKDYAAAGTTDKLKAFAAAHPDHELGGLAQLRVADEDYQAGKFADAAAGYEKAAPALKGTPFAGRAQVGAAFAKLQSGKASDAEAALKQIASDENQLKAIRAEAAYDLASLASAAGKVEDVKKYSDQVMQLDASSPWAQRALMLRATVVGPTEAKDVGPASTPTISLKPAGK